MHQVCTHIAYHVNQVQSIWALLVSAAQGHTHSLGQKDIIPIFLDIYSIRQIGIFTAHQFEYN